MNQADNGGAGGLFSEETSSYNLSTPSKVGEACGSTNLHLSPHQTPPSAPTTLSCSQTNIPSVPAPKSAESSSEETQQHEEEDPNLLPGGNLSSSFEEFTPACTDESAGESYRFQCSRPGQYQCRKTALVFHMKDGGQVLYRILPWSRIQLSPHHKKPAGPLFDISLKEGSMCQLHLPHCEIRSTGGCRLLSVAHVNNDVIEFIRPQKITETHVVIDVTGFSCYGNVKDEDLPSVPIRALVLPFYKPPQDPDTEHIINVLLLPDNVSVNDVVRSRKKRDRDETYIETPPHCKLQPQQVYSLTTSPGGDSVKVQPPHAEFFEDSYNNYLETFKLIYEMEMKTIRLSLKDSSSNCVWERQVRVSSSEVKASPGSARLNLPPQEQLLEVRSSLIERISEPVLHHLLDKLLEFNVFSDYEMESAKVKTTRGERALFVIESVRVKGQKASSVMIEILKDLDPFLCEHLDLI